VMLVLTILAAAFLTWQIYHFVQGNAAPVPPSAAPVAGAALPVSTLPPPVVVHQVPVSAPVLTPRQREYLNLVREYQLTKMERQILEEKAGLANAQKRISDSGANNSLSGVGSVDTSMYGNENSDYQLAYVDRQAGQWTATLNQGEVYKEVHVGSRLENGSKVLSINGNSVVLRLVKGKKLILTFQGSVNVDNDTPGYTVKAKPAVQKTQPEAKTATPPVSENASANAANSQSNAKIAKMLGITSTPVAPVAPAAPGAVPAVTPNASTQDIPAAPLTVTPGTVAPQSTAPTPTPNQDNNQAVAPSNPQVTAQPVPEPEPSVQTAPQPSTAKPVSVKELRENQAEPALSMTTPASAQISWEQAANLQAAAVSNSH
jgi:hypothetical protein